MKRNSNARHTAFTLIELLVVISVIALLISILLPTLKGVRQEARASKCAANLRSVSQAGAVYLIDWRYYPPAYVYGDTTTAGSWQIEQQVDGNPTPVNGYVHWSYWLLSVGEAMPEGAFTCPATPKGGAPATNPGANPEDWDSELGQTNDMGQTNPSEPPRDRQARRTAYTVNAAIMPRNKFNVPSLRRNQLVGDGRITLPFKTILATEFVHTGSDWSTIFAGTESKSHRPITPFRGRTANQHVYDEPDSGALPSFLYPDENEIEHWTRIGPDMIGHGTTSINAVGRSHPSGDSRIGGSANFTFVDGHVERMTVLQSVTKRLWGDHFYSLTGQNTRVATEP